MRRWVLLGVGAVAAATFGLGAMADDDDVTFKVHGEVRSRYEYLDNIADFSNHDDSGDFDDDEYDIWPYRVRVGVEGSFGDNVTGYVELQNFGLFGEEPPFKAFPDPNLQPLGTGFGFLRGGFFDSNSTSLYQAWVKIEGISGSNFDAKIGRQEHVLGNELQMGDLDFYSGISFDGVRGTYRWEGSALDLFLYNVEEQNGGCVGGCSSDNAFFSGATYNWAINDTQELEPYLLWLKTDEDSFVFADALKIYTIGARWSRHLEDGDGVSGNPWDWNAEFAIQTGDLGVGPGSEDHKAWLYEGHIAYNWGHGDSRSRVHLGALLSSGDDDAAAGDPNDGDHEDYLFLFTDVHANNRLGDMDLETFFFSYGDVAFGPFFANGITDINAGYTFQTAGGKHDLMAAVHKMMLAEDYCGLLTCDDDLGTEIDLRYKYKQSRHLNWQAGLAQFSPGDAVELAYGSDDSATRLWGQVELRW